MLRPIEPEDRAFVLALNEQHVELLSPMSDERLSEIQRLADVAAVLDDGDGPVGFVVTFRAGAPYDSANYEWFAARYPNLYYLDRIVLAATARRGGLGTRAYVELEERAVRAGARSFCLEVNADPPNEPSLAFHAGRGFAEVGRRRANGHLVSLQVKPLPGTQAPGST